MNVLELREQRADLVERAGKLIDKADAEDRQMSGEEVGRHKKMLADIDSMKADIESRERQENLELEMNASLGRKTPFEQPGAGSGQAAENRASATPAPEWRTLDGEAVPVLSQEHRMADLYPGESLSLGKAVVGLVTGNWTGAEAEAKAFRAMSTDIGAAGGFVTPDRMMAEFVDKARARIVCLKAGAKTVLMPGHTNAMARVKTDPTLSWAAENVDLGESEPVLERVNVEARTLGCWVPLSIPLIEDSVNAGSLVEQVLARAVAAEIDRVALSGTGTSGEPVGILGDASITNATGTGAMTDFSEMITALTALEVANYSPTALIGHPTDQATYWAMTDGASNAIIQSPELAAIPRFTTTGCTVASQIMGDFRMLAFCIRKGIRIETSKEAESAWSKNQVLIRVTWRGDVMIADPAAFHITSGIA